MPNSFLATVKIGIDQSVSAAELAAMGPMLQEASLIRRFGISIERAATLVLCLLLVIGLFSPWEEYVSHLDFSIASANGHTDFGITRAIFIVELVCILSLTSVHFTILRRTLWLAWPILFLCLWVLLSASWGSSPVSSVNRAGRFILTVLFGCYVVSRYPPLEFVELLTKAFAITVFASLAVMILAPQYGYSELVGENGTAWRGALIHKNSLGAAMSYGIIISAYALSARAGSRVLSALTFLGCVFLLSMSRSAGAIVATIVAGLIAITGASIESRQRAPVLRAFAFVGIGIAMMAMMVWMLGDFDLSSLSGVAGRSATLSGRTAIWHEVWLAVQRRPLAGYGYGFWDEPSAARDNIWLTLNWAVPQAHNNWLDAALQLGLVGLAIMVLIWLIALRRALWLILVRYRNGVLFGLTMLASLLSQSTVETVTFSPGVSALFWLVTSYLYIARMSLDRRYPSRALAHIGIDAHPANDL